MKRLLIVILALLIACTGSSAMAQERTGIDMSYERCAEMGMYMRGLVMGDYMSIKQAPESLQAIARGWAAGITEKPRMVIQLDVENQSQVVMTRAVFSKQPDVVELEAVSQAVVTIWQYLARAAAEEGGVSGASYQEIMQVNGLVNAATMYAEPSRDGDALYILLYEDASPVLLIVSGENGGVSVRGMFLPSEKLARCSNYGEVAMYLLINGFGMPCQEIKPE